MFTILGADGKEYGPVPTEKIHAWIQSRRADLLTRARRDGETGWKPLGDFPEFAAPPVAPGLPPLVAAAPAGTTAGTPAPENFAGRSAREIADGFSARNTPLDVFDCLGRSFELWKAHFLALVGVTLLVCVIQVVAQGVLNTMIPLLGSGLALFINGALYGGLYYFYLGKIRGEPREVADVFAGFTKAYVPLLLVTLISTVLFLLVMAPFFGPMMVYLVKLAIQGRHAAPQFTPFAAVGVLSICLGLVPLLYLGVSWLFALILVIDRGLGPWTAMEVSRRVVSRQWFRVFFVAFLGGILGLVGLIGLFVGIFLTLPLAFGAILCAYEVLFPPPPAPAVADPGTPAA